MRWDVSNTAYHADRTAVSSSALKVFMRSPAEYFRIYVAGTQRAPAPTEPMILGSAVHHLLFEPGSDFEEEFSIRPDLSDCRTADGKPAKSGAATSEGKRRLAEFEATLNGRMPIDFDAYQRAKTIKRAILEHAPCDDLLSQCADFEAAFRWEGDAGVWWKCKPDALGFDSRIGAPVRVDLKVLAAKNAEGIAETYVRSGYHVQTALYDEGIALEYGPGVVHYMIVAVSEPPYDVIAYKVPPEFIELGRQDLAKARAKLIEARERMEKGGAFVESERAVIDMPVPGWVLARIG